MEAEATLPLYDRTRLFSRIVHIGFGTFHRAHQAVYADILASEYDSDWGYTEVYLSEGEAQIADIRAQDFLFTVAEMSPASRSARVVGVIRRTLHSAGLFASYFSPVAQASA